MQGRFVHDKHEEFLGNGIFSVDGIEWKQQRKIASYEFTSKTLKGLCELSFQGNAMRLAKYLLVEAVEKHQPVDMQVRFLFIVNNKDKNITEISIPKLVVYLLRTSP